MARNSGIMDFFNMAASGHDPEAQLQPPGSPLRFNPREMFASVGDFIAIAVEIFAGLFKGNFEGVMWEKLKRGWIDSPSDVQATAATTGVDPRDPNSADLLEDPLFTTSGADRNYGHATNAEARLNEVSDNMRLNFAVAAAGLDATASPAPDAAPADPALRNLPGLNMGRVA